MGEQKVHKPKWLRRLERESWQAELIISGAAIIGTLQLPGLLEQFQHYLLLNYERDALALWFFATSYWALFVYGLVFVFIYHFIVRALWVGLVGLNSVYPQGIVDNPFASKDYQDKVRAEYGDVDGFIARLDQTASGIFGTGFAFAGLFLNLGLLASGAVLLVTFLEGRGVGRTLAWIVGLAPIGIILLGSVVSMVLSTPRLREKEWVKRFHFPFNRAVSRLTYPVNSRFIMVGLLLVSSTGAAKAKGWMDYLRGFLVFGFVCFLVGIALVRSDAMKPEFIDKVYHRLGEDPSTTDHANYADFPTDKLLFEPLIAQRYFRPGDPFWVWVPLPERELAPMLRNCSEPPVDEDLERREERLREYRRITDCGRDYVEVYMDETGLTLPVPTREFRQSVGTRQFGLRFELSGELPTPGEHTLRVITHYSREEDEEGDWRTTYIPFTVLLDNLGVVPADADPATAIPR